MGIFDSDWQRLHKQVSRRCELISLRDFETGVAADGADFFGIIAEIVRESLPHLSPSEAERFVKTEYSCFKEFDVRGPIMDALRNINPAIPESGASEIFEAVRLRFNNPERENEYFLYFIIAKLIEVKKLSISRGAYLIQIARGNIPEPSRLVRLFQRCNSIARYRIAKDSRSG